jgi:hypothetical protein
VAKRSDRVVLNARAIAEVNPRAGRRAPPLLAVEVSTQPAVASGFGLVASSCLMGSRPPALGDGMMSVADPIWSNRGNSENSHHRQSFLVEYPPRPNIRNFSSR